MLTKQARKSPSKPRSPGYVICIDNDGFEVSLEARKLYEVLSDADAQKHNQLRVIDESGEDYLYPARYFAAIKLGRRPRERGGHGPTLFSRQSKPIDLKLVGRMELSSGALAMRYEPGS